MGDADIRPGDRPQDQEPQRGTAEPATARALWPTFMRRTLSEEIVRRETRIDGGPARS